MNIEIANRLVQMRKEKGYSQEALALQLGISRQAVSKWERAESSPDTSNLITLAKLYGVSLDVLLDTDQEQFESEKPLNKTDLTDSKVATEGVDEEAGPEYVKVGWDGIHVKDGEDEVHVGWRGIHVTENGMPVVRIGPGYQDGSVDWDDRSGIFVDDDGVWINGQERDDFSWKFSSIVAGIILCVYLWIGFEFALWHPGWLLFLAVPLVDYFSKSIRKRQMSIIAFQFFVIGGYLFLGFAHGLWHPGWLIFLTIPIFSSLILAISEKNASFFSYSLLVALGYFYMGFVNGVWHPTWIAFLTIPIYTEIVKKLRRSRQEDEF